MRADLRHCRRAFFVGAPAGLAMLVSSSAGAVPPADGPSRTAAPQRETATAPAAAEPAKGADLIFIEAETGAEYVGLGTLSVKRDVVPTASQRDGIGGFVGAMGGAKLLFLSVGPHFRMAHFQDWDLWTLDLDVGFHAPLGKFEPFLRLGGGYARLARAFDKLQDNRNLLSHGYHVSLAFGADYFATTNLTIGARISGDVLALHRAGVNLNSQDGLVNDYLKYDGASAGLGMTGALALGLHF